MIPKWNKLYKFSFSFRYIHYFVLYRAILINRMFGSIDSILQIQIGILICYIKREIYIENLYPKISEKFETYWPNVFSHLNVNSIVTKINMLLYLYYYLTCTNDKELIILLAKYFLKWNSDFNKSKIKSSIQCSTRIYETINMKYMLDVVKGVATIVWLQLISYFYI